ncbi:L-threonine O-3-phosphate decarboxylase [Pseudovibrio ascidiaceicola]|uniref:threonine-phosphate decarboxylase n=1 Tax=Pseudovibrio ascidiaceicola TaxID=285279 RepID=A0A1I4BU02_9HYPH|nr:threonine-phosphate decarboxylase CobD [Pseudovibrio ascidiaceicola]SFK72135.1 L-threonine O-3-phosphate decarboxylase [Pseudovibrio ascidiaceicola]
MQHGGDLSKAIAEFGGEVCDWMDLSTGINPVAYPAAEHITFRGLAELPSERAETALITAARKAYQVAPHSGITATPGTQAIITALPHLLSPSSSIAIVSPTYASHEESWRTAGAAVQCVSAQEAFTATTDHLLLVNPNNPDGYLFSKTELLDLAAKRKEIGGYLIIDEAYMDLYPEASIIPDLDDFPILVLRSFGKFYGLAGLRLGFLVGPKAITTKLQNQLGSWAVSGPALDIGCAALSDMNWQDEMRAFLKTEMDIFRATFQERGISVIGHTNLYLLIDHPSAHQLHTALAKEKIWTRVFDYRKTWLRLGLPASQAARKRFTQTFESVVRSVENHAAL